MKQSPNWPQLLHEFEQSGIGVIEFCRLHSLTRSVFYQQRALAATLVDIPTHEKPQFRRMGSHNSGSWEASFLNSDSESWEAS